MVCTLIEMDGGGIVELIGECQKTTGRSHQYNTFAVMADMANSFKPFGVALQLVAGVDEREFTLCALLCQVKAVAVGSYPDMSLLVLIDGEDVVIAQRVTVSSIMDEVSQ